MIRVHGKVILAGEHAAVRGHAAVVTPLFSRALELSWEESPAFHVSAGPFAEPFSLAVKKAAEILGLPLPSKRFSVVSDIPPRAGLGSSAALSVAIARFFLPPGERSALFRLALSLEDLFHGKSSGMDVAAALASSPILFQRGEAERPLEDWRPFLYLTDTNLRSSTKACVEQVTKMQRRDLDERMSAAAAQVKDAFSRRDIALLAEGMSAAADCFTEWGLVPEAVRLEVSRLEAAGALAVKPTGSGQGGFLLSLWDKPQAGLLSLWPIHGPSDA